MRSASRWMVVALLALGCWAPVRGQRRDTIAPRVDPVRSIHGHLLEGQFVEPACVYYDPYQQEIFVCDRGGHRIAVATGTGIPTFSFGSESTLGAPESLVVDQEGRIYVADQTYPGIRVFDYDGQPLADLDLSAVPAAEHPLRPVALARGSDGTLFIVDALNRRIIVLAADGKSAHAFKSPAARAELLQAPTDIDLMPDGNLAIADSQGVAVQIFSPQGTYLRGWGEHEIGHHNFSLPSGIAVDEAGRIFVSDTLRQDVKIFDADGAFIMNFGGMGSGPGAVRYPVDVATDGAGRVFVVEKNNFRVQLFRVTSAP